jgi:gamma-glutamyltranspeptidase/glutathione hydrolase
MYPTLTNQANYTIAALQAANGTMTLDDLKNYQVSIRPALNITYNSFTIHSTGVPSGGAVALSILKVMEGYSSSTTSSLSPPDVNLSTHRLDEAMRYSYAARSKLGDPDFYKNMDTFEAEMITEETANRIRGSISDDRTKNVSEYGPDIYEMPENHGTSHIVTSDKSGMAITLTSTVNLLFGSLIVVPETGKPPLLPSS